MVRIAVASTDGVVVNSHFGRAEIFRIIDVDDDTGAIKPVESRAVPAVCSVGGHDDEALKCKAELLSDCQVVLVAKIGIGAMNVLEQAGIESYELPGEISSSVDQLIRYRKVKALFA